MQLIAIKGSRVSFKLKDRAMPGSSGGDRAGSPDWQGNKFHTLGIADFD